jgi:rhodanese-related sulfurtransferase
MAVGIANYQEVIESLHDPEVLLIDVREPSEIEENGSIPKSINIPCENFDFLIKTFIRKYFFTVDKVEAELRLSRLGFVAKYLRNKPSFSHKLIFYCKFGEFGQQAAEIANGLGYKK